MLENEIPLWRTSRKTADREGFIRASLKPRLTENKAERSGRRQDAGAVSTRFSDIPWEVAASDAFHSVSMT